MSATEFNSASPSALLTATTEQPVRSGMYSSGSEPDQANFPSSDMSTQGLGMTTQAGLATVSTECDAPGKNTVATLSLGGPAGSESLGSLGDLTVDDIAVDDDAAMDGPLVSSGKPLPNPALPDTPAPCSPAPAGIDVLVRYCIVAEILFFLHSIAQNSDNHQACRLHAKHCRELCSVVSSAVRFRVIFDCRPLVRLNYAFVAAKCLALCASLGFMCHCLALLHGLYCCLR